MKIDYVDKCNQNIFSWIYIYKVLLVRVYSQADILQRILVKKFPYYINAERKG